MRIGLVRHFKVNLPRKRFMTSDEFNEYTLNYDKADVIPNELVIDKEWVKCYCSTLPRAMTTAKTIYHGEIILSDKLIEIPTGAPWKFNFKIPYRLWTVLARFAWIRQYSSQPEGRKATLKRLNEILNTIITENNVDSNILIVSHAGALYEIRKMLLRRGFRGDSFIQANNGKLYVYNNKK
jgi:broad specificity phosphatase PhoE